MRSLVKVVFVLAACGAGCERTQAQGPSPAPGDAPASVAVGRDTIAKWVETQQIISKEKREWQQARELLRSRIELLQGETLALDEKIGRLRDTAREVESKRAESSIEERGIQTTLDSLTAWVTELEAGVRGLVRRLPDPARAKVKPLFDRMPSDPASTRQSLAERYQNVVGILNETNKTNNEITLTTEIRNLSDGTSSEVRAVYVGLAQAYFVSAKGEAGIGRPGAEAWVWEPSEGLAPSVVLMVEVLQSKAKPTFVPVPVRIQ